MAICDCEKSHNGMGLAGRECDCEEEIASLMQQEFEKLLRESKPLEPEFQKIIEDNYWQLIRDSND